jgi:hypothetical protein
VEAAAQDEMAFEQRAGIAENPENVVLRHRLNVKSRVQSLKSKVASGARSHRRRKNFPLRRSASVAKFRAC